MVKTSKIGLHSDKLAERYQTTLTVVKNVLKEQFPHLEVKNEVNTYLSPFGGQRPKDILHLNEAHGAGFEIHDKNGLVAIVQAHKRLFGPINSLDTLTTHPLVEVLKGHEKLGKVLVQAFKIEGKYRRTPSFKKFSELVPLAERYDPLYREKS